MRRRVSWAIPAAGLFGGSFLLPADGDTSGLACLAACWDLFTHYGANHALSLGGWAYYSGFVLANALFLALFAALPFRTSHARLRLWLSALAALHVLSWLVVNLVQWLRGDRFNLEIGYFLWLLAFALLFGAHTITNPLPFPASEPAADAPPAGRP